MSDVTGTSGAGTPTVAARLPPHGLRVVAFLIDLAAVGIPIAFLWSMGRLAGVGSVWLAVVLLAASFVTYTAISIWLAGGATVGKAACGLAVQRADGSPLSATGWCLAWALGRQSAGYVVIDVFGLGSLVTVFDGQRRALHDLGFASRVVAPEETATVPARRRLEDYSTRVEAALDDLRREYRWLLFLWKWLTSIVLLVLMWLLAATRVVARVDHSLSAAQPSTAGGTALSPLATAATWVVTAALTTGAVAGGAAVVPSGEDDDPGSTTTAQTTSETLASSEPVGRWGIDVDEVPTAGGAVREAVLEIRAGPAPALFTGEDLGDAGYDLGLGLGPCSNWGELRLDETVEPDDPRFPTASDPQVIAAWAGTFDNRCAASRAVGGTVLVGLLDDGRLLVAEPADAPSGDILEPRD